MEIQSKSINKKKIIFLFIFFLIVSFTVLFVLFPNYFSAFLNKEKIEDFISKYINPKSEVLSIEQKPSVFEEALKPIYGTPKKIVIDSVGISSDVFSVGVDGSGYLETPSDWSSAGWYKRGAKPAEVGNLLINAHYDDNYGRPAAFWELKNIKLGDTVSVLDSYDRSYNYKVVNIYYIGIDDPERSKVFEPYEENKSVMTLVTCGGVWVAGEGTYSKRLVVNAELIQ